MDKIDILPDNPLTDRGPVSEKFLEIGSKGFIEACRLVHAMPYGYNSDRDDLMGLFNENMGTCTTKHAVIGTLAEELGLPVHKNIGIYAMSEVIVTGTSEILRTYSLPFVPMVHCFLAYDDYRVDLTEGNRNGKNCSIEQFLFTRKVAPNISAKDEYLLYRNTVEDLLSNHPELKGIKMKTILRAREDSLKLLKSNVR